MIAVTGSNGFLGRALINATVTQGFVTRAITRFPCKFQGNLENVVLGNLNVNPLSSGIFAGCNEVIHLAARVHVLKDNSVDPLDEFRRINVNGTINLAYQAVSERVKRFIFISSIGVNGADSNDQPFTSDDVPAPHSPYSVSKYEAEHFLRKLASQTGMEVTIIRPPLIYGPNAPGNFGSLTRAVKSGWPLPLGAVRNKRSLVALDNLVDFITTCITHPQAANQTFLVSDGQDLSTTELVRGMAQAAGVPARLLPVPVWALQAGAKLMGRGYAMQRLCGNLQVDISKARSLLGWVPPLSVEEGLRRAMCV